LLSLHCLQPLRPLQCLQSPVSLLCLLSSRFCGSAIFAVYVVFASFVVFAVCVCVQCSLWLLSLLSLLLVLYVHPFLRLQCLWSSGSVICYIVYCCECRSFRFSVWCLYCCVRVLPVLCYHFVVLNVSFLNVCTSFIVVVSSDWLIWSLLVSHSLGSRDSTGARLGSGNGELHAPA
jgi:hypothetical protein